MLMETTYQHFNTLLMVINSIQEEDIYQNYLIDRIGDADTTKGTKMNFVCPKNTAINRVESLSDNYGLVGLKYHFSDIFTGKEALLQDSNNVKNYGYTVGMNLNKIIKEYYYKSVECQPINVKPTNENDGIYYPTFFGGIWRRKQKMVNNLKFHNCSYYRTK